MRIVSAVAWFALAFAAGSGEAHLPPPPGPMKEVGWHGPGHLCEESFTLAVKADEYVREDIQLEPWYPVSNTVKSAAGWYTITQLRDKPKPSKRRALIASSKLGSLYAYPPDDETDAAKFVFMPRRLSARPVEITFWRVDPSDLRYADWRVAPQQGYDPSQYSEVLKRLDFFSKTPQTGCLNRGQAQSKRP